MNTKNCSMDVFLLSQVDYWLGAIGHSLCYGTILVKMVRVYYIFDNPSVRKKVSYIIELVNPSILITSCCTAPNYDLHIYNRKTPYQVLVLNIIMKIYVIICFVIKYHYLEKVALYSVSIA